MITTIQDPMTDELYLVETDDEGLPDGVPAWSSTWPTVGEAFLNISILLICVLLLPALAIGLGFILFRMFNYAITVAL